MVFVLFLCSVIIFVIINIPVIVVVVVFSFVGNNPVERFAADVDILMADISRS